MEIIFTPTYLGHSLNKNSIPNQFINYYAKPFETVLDAIHGDDLTVTHSFGKGNHTEVLNLSRITIQTAPKKFDSSRKSTYEQQRDKQMLSNRNSCCGFV